MESRYCGQRRNCLKMMQNTCTQDVSYQPLHENVQQALENSQISGCIPKSQCPSLPYVTAYVNPQEYTGLVSPEMALKRGSSFTNLYWPYNECCR